MSLSYSIHLLLMATFLALAHCSSYYDNPEQDPLPPVPDTPEDLHGKWDFEVTIVEKWRSSAMLQIC